MEPGSRGHLMVSLLLPLKLPMSVNCAHMYHIVKYLIYYLLPGLQLGTRVSPVL